MASFIGALAHAIALLPRDRKSGRAGRPHRRRFRWLESFAWLLGMCAVGQSWQSSEPTRSEGDLRVAVRERALALGLRVDPDSVRWLEPPIEGASDFATRARREPLGLLRRARALFVASRPGEPTDIYQAELVRSPLGQLVECSISDVSNTPASSESDLVVRDGTAAWLLRSNGDVLGARVAHFASVLGPLGPSTFEPRDWSTLERLQSRVQALQTYGFLGLLAVDEVRLGSPARSATLRLDRAEQSASPGAGVLELGVAADGSSFSTRLDEPKVPDAEQGRFTWVHAAYGRPGSLVTWSAERLRETWLGERGVSVLKALGFAGVDYAERAIQAVLPSDGSEQIERNLGSLLASKTHAPSNALADFPPAPLTPLFAKPLDGEGHWISLDDDPFVRRDAAGRAPFTFTFLRPDPARPYVQAYVVLWDPRRLELHMVAGAEEPRTADGEHGDGQIPRDPSVLGHLAAAFNGAFRPRHGEFGMGVNHRVYLPPRPYSATVATLSDGSTAFGTWPDLAGVPGSIVSFRQNMTPLLQAGVPNPYRRHYWGGVPDGWLDESFTVRTALCLTRERFVAYIYGTAVDPEALMRAAQAARCEYAIHLDMNAGNTGFEFYRAAPAGRLGELARPLDEDWEARGTLEVGNQGTSGSESSASFDFYARRIAKHMPLMSFPRYIRREARDFFYLTLRPQLGELPLPESWQAHPAAKGWETGDASDVMPAIAHATVAPDAARPQALVHLIALEPRSITVCSDAQPHAKSDELLSVLTASNTAGVPASTSLWLHAGGFEIGPDANAATALRLSGLSEVRVDASSAVAFLGLSERGALVYGEVDAKGAPFPTRALLDMSRALELHDVTLLVERLGFRSPSSAPPTGATRLCRDVGAGGRLLFPETPVVPPQVWAIRQRAPVSLTRTVSTSGTIRPQ